MPTNEPSSSATNSSNPESVNRCAAEAGAKDAAKKLTEAEYLRKQADDAKAAIGAALSDARAAMTEGIDPREWTRRYPLVAVGSALAAGFVTAVLAVPSREQQELKKLEKIRRALHPEPAPSDGKEGKKTKIEVETPESSWWSTLLREAVSLIRPVLLSALTAGLTGRMGGEQSSGRAQAAAGAAVGVADDAAAEARRHHS